MRSQTTGAVASADGTTLTYRQVGSGPGVVILHGAMEDASSHLELAEELAPDFTVIMPNRRGRGQSGVPGEGYGVHREVQDLAALLDATGARRVLGVSSGALITLRALELGSPIDQAVLFEPPLIVNGSLSLGWLDRYERELERGDLPAALVSAMLGAQMGPPILARLPRWLLRMMTALAMRAEDRKPKPYTMTMRMLAPTFRQDGKIVREMAETVHRYGSIDADILLLGGGASPTYLRTALDGLERVIPRAERIELPGANHGATGNRDRGGRPKEVAAHLRAVFAARTTPQAAAARANATG